MSSSALLESARSALDALDPVSMDAADYRALSESDLLELTRLLAEHQRRVQVRGALAAGEIDRRSSRELGQSGLAQRSGHRTPEELVRVTTGSTNRDAFSAVRAGRIALEAAEVVDPTTGEVQVPTEPWLRAVGEGLTAGSLTVAKLDAIRNGLGRPTADISTSVLADAAAQLVEEAEGMDADRLFKRARELRNEIDEAGIADREQARYQARSLRFRQLPDGMSKLTWDLDPESAAVVRDLYDRATSPRRGGPRFVSGDHADTADRIQGHTRTTEQLASDTFLHLLDAGANADSSELLGTGGAVVSVLVSAESLKTGKGAGFITGQTEPVSIATVERLTCGGGTVPVIFENMANHSTSGVNNACSPANNDVLSLPEMVDACIPAVTGQHPGRKPTTSTTTGEITDEPTSQTEYSSANTTICCSTTTDGKSNAKTPCTGQSHPPATTRNRRGSDSNPNHPHTAT